MSKQGQLIGAIHNLINNRTASNQPSSLIPLFQGILEGNYPINVAASSEAEPNDLISVLDGTSFRGTNPINVAEDFSG